MLSFTYVMASSIRSFYFSCPALFDSMVSDKNIHRSDEKTAEEALIVTGSTLHLVLALRGGAL